MSEKWSKTLERSIKNMNKEYVANRRLEKPKVDKKKEVLKSPEGRVEKAL